MEMKRPSALPTVLAAALCLLGAAEPVPVSTAVAEERPDRVLVLRAEGAKFEEALGGLSGELEGELELEARLLAPGTAAPEIDSVLKARRPRAVVLMDNQAIRLYAAVQAAWKDTSPFPPAIALMAVRVDKAMAGMKRVTGISFEVPGVTTMVNLRSLLKDPVRRVGVIHRGAMEDFVKAQAAWCASERIELVTYRIPDGSPDVAKAVRTGVRRLWRKEDVDALWVLNDNFHLTPEIIREGWLPALERFEKPVVVGVENFVSPAAKFGTYAVLPDPYGLGAQAAGLLLRLQEDGWEADDAPALRQPLAITKLLNLRLARKYSRIHEDRVLEIDRVVV
jgi:hypothetical protein